MEDMMKKNQRYVEKNIKSIRKLFIGKHIVVHNERIDAGLDTFEEASKFGIAKYGIDEPFLIYDVYIIKPTNFIFNSDIPTVMP